MTRFCVLGLLVASTAGCGLLWPDDAEVPLSLDCDDPTVVQLGGATVEDLAYFTTTGGKVSVDVDSFADGVLGGLFADRLFWMGDAATSPTLSADPVPAPSPFVIKAKTDPRNPLVVELDAGRWWFAAPSPVNFSLEVCDDVSITDVVAASDADHPDRTLTPIPEPTATPLPTATPIVTARPSPTDVPPTRRPCPPGALGC